MKQIVSIFMAIMLVLSLAACGGESELEIETPNGVSNNQSGDKNPTTSKPKDAQIEETVLFNDSGIKITAKSLTMDGFMGPELKLSIENTSGKNLTVQDRNTSVNGYMVDSLMSVDVADGKTANDSLTFMDTSLELCGIDVIATMEFSFTAFDADSWDDYITTEQITLKTNSADSYTDTADHSGQLAYEEDGIKIVIKGLTDDASILGQSVVVYIENNSDQNITVQTQDVSVNGFMVDPIFSCDVVSGKRTVDSITFLSSELEENGIADIENIELSFNIFNSDTWNDIADTDVITIEF